MEPLLFRLDPRLVAKHLTILALSLIALNIGSAILWADDGLDVVSYKYVCMFDLDEEESFGTWFAVFLLFAAGQLTLLVARNSRRAADGVWQWWMVLGIGFHVLSIDEIVGMHEFLNTYGEELLGLSSRWTTYALMGVGLLALSFAPFLWRLHRLGHGRMLALLVLSGCAYVGGAVVVEKISPSDSAMFVKLAYAAGWISLEEGLEMGGIILVIYALLDFLRGSGERDLTLEVAARRFGSAGEMLPGRDEPPKRATRDAKAEFAETPR